MCVADYLYWVINTSLSGAWRVVITYIIQAYSYSFTPKYSTKIKVKNYEYCFIKFFFSNIFRFKFVLLYLLYYVLIYYNTDSGKSFISLQVIMFSLNKNLRTLHELIKHHLTLQLIMVVIYQDILDSRVSVKIRWVNFYIRCVPTDVYVLMNLRFCPHYSLDLFRVNIVHNYYKRLYYILVYIRYTHMAIYILDLYLILLTQFLWS